MPTAAAAAQRKARRRRERPTDDGREDVEDRPSRLAGIDFKYDLHRKGCERREAAQESHAEPFTHIAGEPLLGDEQAEQEGPTRLMPTV